MYKLTKLILLKDEAMITIAQLHPDDMQFGFSNGNFLSLQIKVGKWNKGSTIRILFVGQIRQYRQWPTNFSLDLVPFTREAFINATDIIDVFTEGIMPCILS